MHFQRAVRIRAIKLELQDGLTVEFLDEQAGSEGQASWVTVLKDLAAPSRKTNSDSAKSLVNSLRGNKYLKAHTGLNLQEVSLNVPVIARVLRFSRKERLAVSYLLFS